MYFGSFLWQSAVVVPDGCGGFRIFSTPSSHVFHVVILHVTFVVWLTQCAEEARWVQHPSYSAA